MGRRKRSKKIKIKPWYMRCLKYWREATLVLLGVVFGFMKSELIEKIYRTVILVPAHVPGDSAVRPPPPDLSISQGLSYKNMTVIIRDYVDNLIAKYPYWNRSDGAGHFLVTCLEGGMKAIQGVPSLTKHVIRVACASSTDLGFSRPKDVSLPQVPLPFLLGSGGNDLENRKGLAYWSSNPNHHIREEMAQTWKDDVELDVSNNYLHMLRGGQLSAHKFLTNKFCICPRGKVYSTPRIVEAIHYGCVPVILSDRYIPPFSTILDWPKFSVAIEEKDVLDLKNVLKRINDSEFALLHKNLVKVQKHFQWNTPPVKYDAFHMVMYELWMRVIS